ncbi:hypothetical protein PR003_g4257 [Phytophthora rubi]|uniref:Uncharacterized protein n=1 Tax=Phytophthora rubi TaxID=129364 RepID=A0A6A4FWI8_9STRA|nr:hypothetical protein PR003_g4257 [Phytophthora rubi]
MPSSPPARRHPSLPSSSPARAPPKRSLYSTWSEGCATPIRMEGLKRQKRRLAHESEESAYSSEGDEESDDSPVYNASR